MPSALRDQIIVAAIAAAIFFLNLGKPTLWDRDEPRNAGAAREMLEREDFIVPTFNGELRAHKPALLYWLMIAAYKAFGINEFSARFFSATLAVGTCLVTYQLGRLLFHPRVGLWAGIVLATSLNFGVVSRAATPDSTLIFFSTLSLLVFLHGIRQDLAATNGEFTIEGIASRPPSLRTLVSTYFVMGVAVLAKGLIGFILPCAVIGMFLVCAALWRQEAWNSPVSPDGHRRNLAKQLLTSIPYQLGISAWRMRPLTLAVTILAIAGPWYLAVGARTGGSFLAQFFGEHHVGRFMNSMEGHGGSVLYYPLVILAGFFPWSSFMIPVLAVGLSPLRRKDDQAMGLLFCFCWIAAYVGFFSLAGTKLPSYVVPAYPALALLTGFFFHRVVDGSHCLKNYWPHICLGCTFAAGVAMMVGGYLAARRYLPGGESIALIGLIPCLGGAACLLFWQKGRIVPAIHSFAGMAVALAIVAFGVVIVHVASFQGSQRLMDFIRENSSPARALASYAVFEPSWAYYAGQSFTEYGTTTQVINFLNQTGERFVVTTDEHWSQLQGKVSGEISVLASHPRFLKDGDWLVLGRPLHPGSNTIAVRLGRYSTTR